MSDNQAGAIIGGTALGAVGGLLLSRKNNPSTISDDVMLAAIDRLSTAIENLNSLLTNQGNEQTNLNVVFSYPKNPKTIITQIMVPATAGIAVRLPDITIPPDMQLVIKAQHTNFGLIRIGKTAGEAQNPAVGYVLIANESIAYRISNANELWVCNTVAGEGIHITVEQEG